MRGRFLSWECIVKIRLQTKGNFDVQCSLACGYKIGHKLASGQITRAGHSNSAWLYTSICPSPTDHKGAPSWRSQELKQALHSLPHSVTLKSILGSLFCIQLAFFPLPMPSSPVLVRSIPSIPLGHSRHRAFW